MMNRLTYELNGMCHRNNEGSFATQDNRKRMLRLFAKQLKQLGYRNLNVTSLKTKHVQRLLEHWRNETSTTTNQPITTATIKNRMSALRWWANKINKQNIIPRDNKSLNIEDRRRIPITSRAISLSPDQLRPLPRHLQYSLRLQQEFGLRREEAAKFRPVYAIKENHILIARSWAKGGRERIIPITTNRQRELATELSKWRESQSMIPSNVNYKSYLMHREDQLRKADIKQTHRLRHYYAQQRYIALTSGLQPRILRSKEHLLTQEEKHLDYMARSVVSQELGHSRIDITRIYLG